MENQSAKKLLQGDYNLNTNSVTCDELDNSCNLQAQNITVQKTQNGVQRM